jgi:predicted PurR-regulated permease PerM
MAETILPALTADQIVKLDAALDPNTTTDKSTLPVVSSIEKNAASNNADENLKSGAPANTPIVATGNANNSSSAIKKSNETVSKACGTNSYVGKAVAQMGAYAGQLMRKLREAIKMALASLGFNPGSSAIMSKLKKFAQWLKDQSKWIKEITNYLNKFIAYVNAIKQLIAFLLTLPARLLTYFKECIDLLKKQLVSSFTEALGADKSVSDMDIQQLQSDINQIKGDIQTFTSSVQELAATTTTAVLSVVDPAQIAIANTQMQAEATQTVFSAAGFSDTKDNFSKA